MNAYRRSECNCTGRCWSFKARNVCWDSGLSVNFVTDVPSVSKQISIFLSFRPFVSSAVLLRPFLLEFCWDLNILQYFPSLCEEAETGFPNQKDLGLNLAFSLMNTDCARCFIHIDSFSPHRQATRQSARDDHCFRLRKLSFWETRSITQSPSASYRVRIPNGLAQKPLISLPCYRRQKRIKVNV